MRGASALTTIFIPFGQMIGGLGWAFAMIGCIGAVSTVLIGRALPFRGVG